MSASLTREQSLDLYYYLRLNRSLEELLGRLVRQNKIHGGVYGSRGQEAISVGAASALGPDDWMAPAIRNIGAMLVRGFRPRDFLTQHMATANSPTRGRDGTSHFGDLETRHVVAPTSVLGEMISVMTGVAMAARYLGHPSVALTWIGDGGTSTGAFHEGMNLAAVQKAPLVVIVENNQWAYSTPVSHQVPVRDLADRARAYGIASAIVDGNDVLAVRASASEAAEQARAGHGPVLIEAKTMRMAGHAQHDSADYVPRELLEEWKRRDPIEGYERHLTEGGLWDARQKAALDARVERELADDLAFAESSPAPSADRVGEGVFCEGCHTVKARWARPPERARLPRGAAPAHGDVHDAGERSP